MHRFKLLSIGALMLLTITSCKDKKQEESLYERPNQESIDQKESEIAPQKVVGYDYGDKSIKLNGWLLEKSVMKYQNIILAMGIKPDSVIEAGKSHYDEYGYRYYTCYFKDSNIKLSSESLKNDVYYVHDFLIKSKILNINGITIDDSIDRLKKEFPKHNISEDEVTIYLEDQAIVFYHINGIITSIQLYTPT